MTPAHCHCIWLCTIQLMSALSFCHGLIFKTCLHNPTPNVGTASGQCIDIKHGIYHSYVCLALSAFPRLCSSASVAIWGRPLKVSNSCGTSFEVVSNDGHFVVHRIICASPILLSLTRQMRILTVLVTRTWQHFSDCSSLMVLFGVCDCILLYSTWLLR